jgi:uncharacterized membrane protein YidH (DUF202 family)
MEDERRRKQGLTPLSGELHAPEAWTQPGPVAEQYKPKVKPEKRAPTTTRGMLVHGVKRFVLVLAGLGAATALVALAFVWLADASAARAFPLTFYLAGALVIAGGVLLSTGGSADWIPEAGFEREERESWIGSSLVYVAIGIPLIAIGALLDNVL